MAIGRVGGLRRKRQHSGAGRGELSCRRGNRTKLPLPWFAEETESCFIVRDHNGQALAYIYFEAEQGRRAAAKLLMRDEARRIAANIAKLPGLLTQGT